VVLTAARGANWGVLTVYAVQFRYDVDPVPLELDRHAFNERVSSLVRHVDKLLQRPEDEQL